MFGPEINHRNVDLYHRILNGGEEFVSGAGAIFQTWLSFQNHGAIAIGEHGETFAFTSEIIPSLQQLVSQVDRVRVEEQYSAWLKIEGKSHIPSAEECEEFSKEFSNLSLELQAIAESGNGIIWISC